ncbi:Ig-like domain-containing protein [Bradyrhizobium sp. UFLA05-112]
MTTYWVEFVYNMDRGNFAPDDQNFPGSGQLASFLGNPVYGPSVDPTPYSSYPFGYIEQAYAAVPQGNWELVQQPNGLNWHFEETNIVEWTYTIGIGNYFVAGSQPDPTILVGPTATDSATEAQPSPYEPPGTSPGIFTVQWTTYAWEEINVGPPSGPIVNISNAPTVHKSASQPQTETFTVSLSSPSSDTITVDYATHNGTAIAGADFQDSHGTLTFAPGQTTQTIQVPLLENPLSSPPSEQFSVVLSNLTESGGTGAVVGINTGFGAIDQNTLFTTGAETVNFNSLTDNQAAAIDDGADLYNALGGGDTITLPNADPGDTSIAISLTDKTFDLHHTFAIGDSPTGVTTNVYGSSGSYNLALGAGAQTVTINGAGTTKVAAGSGVDSFSISGGGTLEVNGNLGGGSATIGANSTLELNGADIGTITFAGTNATLKIDGSTTPTGVISGFTPGDSFDIASLPFDGHGYTIWETSTKTLQFVDNGAVYNFSLSQPIVGGVTLFSDKNGGTEIAYISNPATHYSTSPAPPPPALQTFNPYSAVVQLTYTAPDGDTDIGTGFIVGPHTILTAAHVLTHVKLESPLGPVSGPIVTINGVDISIGTFSTFTDPQYVSSATFNDLNEIHDFGVINTSVNLASYGMFQLTSGFAAGSVNITGYPGGLGPQYNSIQNVILGATGFLEDPGNLGAGASGGPVWVSDGSSSTAVGIYVGVPDASLQFTPADISEILGWEALGLSLSKVAEGYISGATVFADANGTGQLASNDVSTTTDSTGSFSLSGGSGPLIAYGGTDTSLGLQFKGQLSAPAGSTDITPLTTLLTDLASDSFAQTKVLTALGLSTTLDLTTFDPIAAAQGGSPDGAAAEVAGEKVYDTVSMIASALAGMGAAFSPSLQAAFSSLASALDATGINLSDKTALSALFTQVAQMEGITLGQGTADTIASVIAAGNAALDHVLQTDQSGAQLLSDAAGIALVEQGAASTAITNAAGNSSQLQVVANLFTGANLGTLIAQAQNETQSPGQDLGPIAFNGATSTDQNTVLKASVSAVDLAGNGITYALDGTAPAGLTFNSDGTFSFDPGTNYKYLALGESTTMSFKFTASDGRGTAGTGTETITINGLNDPPTLDSTHTTASETINELPHTTGSTAIDKVTGVIAFTDPDLSHRPAATIDTKDETFSYQDSSGHDYALTPAQIATFEAAISIQPESGNTNAGTIDWVFSFADKQIDFVGTGESVTATIPVVIDDQHGGTVTQDVVVTIDGANDNPVAAPDGNVVAWGRTLKVAADEGVLANDSDPDIHDKLTVQAVDGKTKAVGHAIEGKYGWLTLNADGSYTYTASRNHDDFGWYHRGWDDRGWDDRGGIKQDTFTYTVSDGHGGLTTSTLNIVVFEKGTTYLSGANTTLTAAHNGPYVLDGSARGDTLKAGHGDAVLIGGSGDTLIAGKGDDTFLFRPDFGNDIIKNFNIHEDTLEFDHSIFRSTHDILAHTTNTAAGAAISDGQGGTVTLLGVTTAELHAHEHDFHLV